jgi:hypothetical protein
MFFWYHKNQRGDLWPVRSAEKLNQPFTGRRDSGGSYQVVGEVLEIPEELYQVPLLELCKRYPPPGL